ncbi:DUF4124 domain-containing protein [Roseateles sp. GG27B]
MPCSKLPFTLRRQAGLGLLILCLCSPALAQWAWRDAGGKMQFSDLPPPRDTPERDILKRPPKQQEQQRQAVVVSPYLSPASAAAAAASAASASADALAKTESTKQDAKQQQLKQRQEQDALAKQQQLQQDQARKLAEQRRDNCSRAQDNLRLLQARTKLLRTNERGESVLLDETQREAELQRTRSVISSDCG